MMGVLERLWEEHRRADFPGGCRGEEIAGVELVMLDADIAGCVETYLRRPEVFDEDRLAILRSCLRDAARVQSRLDAESRVYFARVKRLAHLLLERVTHGRSPA